MHCFNELDRNIRNHSGYIDKDNNSYIYNACYCPRAFGKGIIQFTMLDDGVRFYGTMYKYENPVLEALKKGVTTRSNWDKTTGEGRNSGYGLYLFHELSKLNGNRLEIITNNKLFANSSFDIEVREVMQLKGLKEITLVSLTLDLDSNLIKAIKDIENNFEGKSGKSILKIDM